MESLASCPFCKEILPGPAQLAHHIIEEHCEDEQKAGVSSNHFVGSELSPTIEIKAEEEDNENIESEISHAASLPRLPTTQELSQMFMSIKFEGKRGLKHACLLCDKMLVHKYSMKMHINLHLNRDIYMCSHCGKKFTRPSVYRNHLRVHTGERPFPCDKCDRKFADKSNCTAHKKKCKAKKVILAEESS